MRYLLLGLMFASSLSASLLVFSNGEVTAHTEVFGDSSIDPKTSAIFSKLTIEDDASTLRGEVDVSLIDLKSDNEGRDEHMHKVLDSSEYTKTTFTVEDVKKRGSDYEVDGTLNLHGVSKHITLKGDIIKADSKVRLVLKNSFKMSEFGIEPPTMAFVLKVRDQVDISVDTTFDIKR